MASAVLASQNESSWAHMGKTPYSNPHLNSNPNPNPKKKQKQFHPSAANGVASRYNNVDSPAVTQTASDDAYSFNQTPAARSAGNYGGYLTFNVATYAKSELLELRKRLTSELDRIRDLRDRVESGRFNIGENPRSQAKSKKISGSGSKRPGAAIGSVPKKLSDGHDNGSLDAVNFGGLLKECEKIVGKLIKNKYGYIFRTPVDAAALGLHDYHLIVKQPMDLGTVKANLTKSLYRTPVEFAADVRLTFNNALLYNPKTDPVNGMAGELLARFEEMFKPVQERFDSMLGQRREKEPREMRINNDLPFREVKELQGSSWSNHGSQIITGKKSKPKHKSSPVPVAHVVKKPERMHASLQAHSTASTPSDLPPPIMNSQPLEPEPLPPSPVKAPPPPPAKEQKGGRAAAPKQPKPRAKDPNKREMSMDEKQKLGLGLQSLPQEKMPQLVQIIRKRNEHLAQDGDEIELDIEALDTETLWELDRFVTNWKKMVSKTKRQALMMNNNTAAGVAAPTSPIADADAEAEAEADADADLGAMSDKQDDSGRKFKDNDDEDVDIDDDMPAASFPPVEIEKDEGVGGAVAVAVGGGGAVGAGGQDQDQDRDHGNNGGGGNASSSSSSSGSSNSDSSSSSDSDSGSSSGSDSDADDAQS